MKISRPTLLLAISFLVSGLALSTKASERPKPNAAETRRPNVVFFLVDDMGWVDSGVYGSQYYETPHIDRLASRGMLFTNAYAANPLCSPTRASILTGKYPARLGIVAGARRRRSMATNTPRLLPESRRFLDPGEYTLAEALGEAGYRTGHFGKWHLGVAEGHWPEHHGYDVAWHGVPDAGPSAPNGYFSPYSFEAGNIEPGPKGEYIVDRLTDEVLSFIEDNRDRMFFASVWQYGVHGPWDHKEEYTKQFVDKKDPRGQQGNPVMASMLKSVDESLGRIVDKLDELGLIDNTIILFTSDNGGNVHSNTRTDERKAMADLAQPRWRWLASYRRYAQYLPPTNNYPLRFGKGTLYEGGVRVPLIVSWPGAIPMATTSSEVVSSIDYYPTLLALLGLQAKEGVLFDGISLAPVLRDPGRKLDREAVFNFFPPEGGLLSAGGVTIRSGEWKLIRWFQAAPDQPSHHELFNLTDDPGETKNLAATRPAKVRELDAQIDLFLKDVSCCRWGAKSTPES